MIISFRDDHLMSLRAEQRELTRRTIVGAVLALLAEGSLDELSVPAVARRSGVSLATIYRYFPTRDDLVMAAAQEPQREALATAIQSGEAGADELATFQRALWHEFASNLELLRHQVGSSAGREMREARIGQARAQLSRYLRPFGIEASTAEGERLISLLMLVSGSLALLELHDRQHLSVEASLETSLWAGRALIEATRRELEAAAAVPSPPSKRKRSR
jgi:AcrR family transcriptional regulator